MENTLQTYRTMARNVLLLHLGWLIMMFTGTIVEIYYPQYAPIHLLLIVATALFQILLGQGGCPLTLFENFLYEKSDPDKFYLDRNGNGSFIRHYLKKWFNINAPKGTTTALLLIMFAITIGVILSNYSL